VSTRFFLLRRPDTSLLMANTQSVPGESGVIDATVARDSHRARFGLRDIDDICVKVGSQSAPEQLISEHEDG
jgi:hypothetical protein